MSVWASVRVPVLAQFEGLLNRMTMSAASTCSMAGQATGPLPMMAALRAFESRSSVRGRTDAATA
jgi:hypothetical protein